MKKRVKVLQFCTGTFVFARNLNQFLSFSLLKSLYNFVKCLDRFLLYLTLISLLSYIFIILLKHKFQLSFSNLAKRFLLLHVLGCCKLSNVIFMLDKSTSVKFLSNITNIENRNRKSNRFMFWFQTRNLHPYHTFNVQYRQIVDYSGRLFALYVIK